MKTPMEKIEKINSFNQDEYNEHIVKKIGYDPMKELRINKLEKMCKMITNKKTNCIGGTNNSIPDKDIDFFFSIVDNIKPIMFLMTGDLKDQEVSTKSLIERDLKIDIPFETFSIEPADDWHGLYTIKTVQGMLNAVMIVVHEETPENLILFTMFNFIPGPGAKTLKAFEFVEKSTINISKGIKAYVDSFKNTNYDPESLYIPISLYLSKLDNRSANVEYKVRTRIKTSRGKRILKLNPGAILIDPSKKYSVKAFGTRQVEWQISWVVRGHWRRFKGTGKDRSGSRNAIGWTWVNSYQKGEGDISNKTRIVK